jgi:hypothetical protein
MDQRTPFDEDFYPDILRGLAVYFDSPLVHNIARTVQRVRRQDLSIALNRKQIACKTWLIDELHKAYGGDYRSIWVMGGWYGVLSALICEDPRYTIAEIVSYDIDEGCEDVAECLNREHAIEGRFKARTADMLEIDYAAGTPDLVVNTSCEHLEDVGAWLDLIPRGTRLVLQSNNYFGEPDHFNCASSLEEFKAQAPISTIDYEGELALKNYTRYMLIGSR